MKQFIIFSIFLNFSLILCNLEPLHIDSHIIENEQENEVKGWPNSEPEQTPPPVPSNEECAHRIYSDCNYPTHFTDEELENARKFLNYSFTVLADIKPDKPLCHKLHVRHDWKCLSQQQKQRVTNVWKELYKRGDIERLTNIHASFWTAWHKSVDFLTGHRWLIGELERMMRSLDPGVTLPYWDPYIYGTQPERSSIWDTLGHSGNYSNGYAVTDGIYGEMDLPTKIKRHWSPRGTVYPMETPETVTSWIQTSKDFQKLGLKFVGGFHFTAHLNLGGYEGQLSVPTAPNDMVFHLFHASVSNHFFKWQLLDRKYLTPLTHSSHHFNPRTGVIELSDIITNVVNGVPWFKIIDEFYQGFGDNCFIADQMIRPLSNAWKGIRDPTPSVVKRIPDWILRKYFPLWVSGNYSAFSHTFEEVGECNTKCLPLPKPTFLLETEQGRKQLRAFQFDESLDLLTIANLVEQSFYRLWYDLNKSGYCSPYVTTY